MQYAFAQKMGTPSHLHNEQATSRPLNALNRSLFPSIL